MASPATRTARSRFTLRQLMPLVSFSATLCAAAVPLARGPRDRRLRALVVEFVVVPVVLGDSVRRLCRPSPTTAWASALLLNAPAVALAGLCIALAIWAVSTTDAFMALPLVATAALASWVCVLRLRVGLPRPCPGCRRRALVRHRDRRSPLSGPLFPTHRCAACGRRFLRWHRGPWEPLDPETGLPLIAPTGTAIIGASVAETVRTTGPTPSTRPQAPP